jgi:hypothetical protein
MLLLLFSAIDIAAGLSLAVPNFLGFYLGIMMLVKGIYSFTSCLAMNDVGFTLMGLLDILAGVSLAFSFAIPWLWLIVLIKGVVSLMTGLGS